MIWTITTQLASKFVLWQRKWLLYCDEYGSRQVEGVDCSHDVTCLLYDLKMTDVNNKRPMKFEAEHGDKSREVDEKRLETGRKEIEEVQCLP